MFVKCCFGEGNSSGSGRGYPTVIEELCPPFSLSHLKKATNNFHQNRIIRGAGFAKVYKGCLRNNDGSDYAVAVKRLKGEFGQEWEQKLFKNEIELLCQLRHPNIISLKGFCNHKDEKIIVYEYMSNGSLYERLQGGELSWKKRVEICIGTARGLHYLHAGLKRTIIHRHINLSNILLDHNMHPKLTNFGLSVKGAHFMSKPKPIQVDSFIVTLGYIAPENLRKGMVTDKSDVYSFGMVLLEVVSGRTFFDIVIKGEVRDFLKKPVEEYIDPNIKGKIAPECWQVFVDIIAGCLKNEPDERPAMGEVQVQLEHALSLQKQADITNTNVAVKRFKLERPDGWGEFMAEVELHCQLHHPHIISLIGFCIHKKEKIMVFEYMPNGSLHGHLQGGELSWKKRIEICIGAARGLHYLQAGAKRTIIHRHIKPSYILLDHNMHPKLVGFGLSIQGARFMSKPKPIQLDIIRGTLGYIAPEYYQKGIVTDKSDVYSFGIVLLEVVWGRTVYDIVKGEARDSLEKPVEEDIDPNIKGKIAPQCWQVFADIMVRCLEDEADERPTMGEVEVELERALSVQEQQDIANTNGRYTLISTTIIPSEDIWNLFYDSDSEQSIVSILQIQQDHE